MTSYATWLYRFYIVRMISDCGIHRIRSGSNSPQKRRLGAQTPSRAQDKAWLCFSCIDTWF